MLTPLKKRTFRELHEDVGGVGMLSVWDKQLPARKSLGYQEIHLNNLATLFPEFDGAVDSRFTQVLQATYASCHRNIDRTLKALEELQSRLRAERSELQSQKKEGRDSKADDRAIDSELSQEMSSIDSNTRVVLQRLGGRAQQHILDELESLAKCANKDEAHTVLISLLDKVFGDSLEAHQRQVSELQAKYFVAKKAVHQLGHSLARKDRENEHLRGVVERHHKENAGLKEMNKFLMRELEKKETDERKGFRPFFEPDGGVC